MPHGFRFALLRHVPVRHLSVHDPLRADDAGEADVDHAPLRLDVEPDAEAGEEDAGGREQPHRPDGGRRARRPVAPRNPDAAAEQVDERGIRERRAPEDLALVEEAERDREREQREQVEIAERERPPQVGEADDEERAERQPQPDAVDRPAAERAGAAARHRPGDLRPRPGLGHLAGAVVDLAEHDLARLARPGLDDPLVRRRAVLGGRRRLGRVPVEPVRNLLVAEEDRDRLLLGQAGTALGGDERRLDQPPVLVEHGLGRRCRRPGRSGERERRERSR